MDQESRVGRGRSMKVRNSHNKKTIILSCIIVLHCIISTESMHTTHNSKLHLHHHSSTSHKSKKLKAFRRNEISTTTRTKLSVAEALGCDAGLTRSVFMYMDNICHRCFSLFREMEIYYMCR